MKKETKQWIEIAEDDIDMMRIAMDKRKYAYAVLFAQQAVEKIIKAYIIEHGKKKPRKIHALEELLKDTKLDLKETKNLNIKDLSKAYARVRYPDLSGKYYESARDVKDLLVTAEKIYVWIKQKLAES